MTQPEQHCLWRLAQRYPQLIVPVAEGARATAPYSQLVLRGKPIPNDATLGFSCSPEDSLTIEHTPAGDAEVLCLRDRADFEHAVQALAHRCEPVPIPRSMGAITINGLTDWGKVNAHKREWLAEGGSELQWPRELKFFALEPANIRSTLIILSSGFYSAVSPEVAGMDEASWLDASLTIRKHHELAHFTSQRLFPQNRDALRDEVVADLVGLWAAFGCYRVDLALAFLGLGDEGLSETGRLRNYLGQDDDPLQAQARARQLIGELASFTADMAEQDCLAVLQRIEREHVGLS